MRRVMRQLKKMLHREEGLSAVEYAIAGALVIAAAAAAFATLGTNVTTRITELANCVAGTGC